MWWLQSTNPRTTQCNFDCRAGWSTAHNHNKNYCGQINPKSVSCSQHSRLASALCRVSQFHRTWLGITREKANLYLITSWGFLNDRMTAWRFNVSRLQKYSLNALPGQRCHFLRLTSSSNSSEPSQECWAFILGTANWQNLHHRWLQSTSGQAKIILPSYSGRSTKITDSHLYNMESNDQHLTWGLRTTYLGHWTLTPVDSISSWDQSSNSSPLSPTSWAKWFTAEKIGKQNDSWNSDSDVDQHTAWFSFRTIRHTCRADTWNLAIL